MFEKLLLAATITFSLNLLLGLSSPNQQPVVESRQGPLQVAHTSDRPNSPRLNPQQPDFAQKRFD
jgi:hypothetical protein